MKTDQPVREIVEYTLENGSDRIGIASSSRRRAERLLCGSVSERIVRHAPTIVVADDPSGSRLPIG